METYRITIPWTTTIAVVARVMPVPVDTNFQGLDTFCPNKRESIVSPTFVAITRLSWRAVNIAGTGSECQTLKLLRAITAYLQKHKQTSLDNQQLSLRGSPTWRLLAILTFQPLRQRLTLCPSNHILWKVVC